MFVGVGPPAESRVLEDVSDAIAKRSTDRLAHYWRHAGIALLFVLPGSNAEPQPAERPATARGSIRRESRQERRTRSGPGRATCLAAHRPAVRQPGTLWRTDFSTVHTLWY